MLIDNAYHKNFKTYLWLILIKILVNQVIMDLEKLKKLVGHIAFGLIVMFKRLSCFSLLAVYLNVILL